MSFDQEPVEDLANAKIVSIPFEQGDVFRQWKEAKDITDNESQSLSSRAMSFDLKDWRVILLNGGSQSLSSRAMSFDSTSFTAWTTRVSVSIPFEQGDVFRQKQLRV